MRNLISPDASAASLSTADNESDQLTDFAGLARRSPWIAFLMMVFAGLSAGAVITLAPRMTTFVLFVGVLLGPPITVLLGSGVPAFREIVIDFAAAENPPLHFLPIDIGAIFDNRLKPAVRQSGQR